jgi:hypothetical protein
MNAISRMSPADPLGNRGQIRLGDRPSRQERRRPVTGRHEDVVGRARMEMHVVIESRSEAVQKGDGAESRASYARPVAVTGRARRSTKQSFDLFDEDPREGRDRVGPILPGRNRKESTVPKRWLIRPHDRQLVAELERKAGVSSIVAQLLAARGLVDPSDAKRFLAGTLSDLRDPETLPGVPEAADRLLAAAKAGRPIVVYGDYDADGMCATAILIGCLEAVGGKVSWYVPDRFEEGYGLNGEALAALAAEGAAVVVTVDCGIASVAEARRARELGLELIVTDHHTFADTLPEADVLVHPRLPGGGYPLGDLCGAGVAFKLAWAIATRFSGAKQVTPRLREMLLRSIGLAALGTVADVVPLVDENRITVRHGLELLRSRGGAGIAKLLELASLNGKSQVEKLAPFGQGNRRPVLCASSVHLAEPPRAIGGGGRHISMNLVQHGKKLRGVAFGGADWLPHLPAPGQPFHIAFKPKINEFRGRGTAEMEVVDWRPDGVAVDAELPPLAAAAV